MARNVKNVEFQIDGDKLVIVVDLSKEFGLSGSGKSIIIGTTSGNVNVDGDVYVGVNVYRPAD